MRYWAICFTLFITLSLACSQENSSGFKGEKSLGKKEKNSPYRIFQNKKAKTLRVATEAFAPYMGPSLKDGGVLVELTTLIARKAGYQVEVKFLSWARALQIAKTGQAHILLGAYHTNSREAFFHYSLPLARNREVLFVRKDRGIKSYKSLRDLTPYVIGVVTYTAHSPEFDSVDYLEKEIVPSREINIKKLLAGRVDLIAEPLEVTQHLMKEKFPHRYREVTFLTPPLAENLLYAAFSKEIPENREILKAFNRAFENLIKSGRVRELFSKHNLMEARVPR